jgi:hypothetical protein
MIVLYKLFIVKHVYLPGQILLTLDISNFTSFVKSE